MKAKDKTRIASVELKFLTGTAKYISMDNTRSEEVSNK
jgi:hypothetical protein